MPVPYDIEQRIKGSADYNLDCWLARRVFNAVGLTSKKARWQVGKYCVKAEILARAGAELPAALFALKRVLQAAYGKSAIPIREFLPTKHGLEILARDWYHRLYPEWDGTPPAVLAQIGASTTARIIYALAADRLLGLSPPFCVYAYEGKHGEQPIYLISQELLAFIGPAVEEAPAALQPVLEDSYDRS